MTNWSHSPLHMFNEKGTYMITGATLNKEHFFKTSDELDLLESTLQKLASQYCWNLEAWALFSNHYHFIAQSPEDPSTLRKFITHFHSNTARALNVKHQTLGRKIWFQYWDSQITFQNSYLARLNYVIQNPVKHKIVDCAKMYKWCSANWFENTASKSHYSTVVNFQTNLVSIFDDF
jgi:putative transposase